MSANNLPAAGEDSFCAKRMQARSGQWFRQAVSLESHNLETFSLREPSVSARLSPFCFKIWSAHTLQYPVHYFFRAVRAVLFLADAAARQLARGFWPAVREIRRQP